MITKESIPTGYKAYQSITICSNEIVGGGHLFVMGNVLPLLIGVGPKPTIWLQAVAAPNSKEFITIVDASIATHPAVRVSEEGSKVTVVIGDKTVLAVEALSEQKAIVSELDLRPIGLNVHGNASMLYVGGMQISHSTFVGVGTAFGFGA
jgi:hypothetical protein